MIGLALASGLASAGNLTSEWKARYATYTKTITSRNFPAWKRYIAKDFVWIQPDGKQKARAEAIAEFGGIFKMKQVTGDEKVLGVKKSGDTVAVQLFVDFTMVDENGKKSVYQSKCVDYWRKIGGRWQMVKSVDEPAKK